MATAKMKIILPLVVWIWLLHTTAIAQTFGGIGFGIKEEKFFLRLTEGYFACQVNESKEVLQLLELSKLCDGTADCFLGSDELRDNLLCTNDCRKDDGTVCQNGACLDHQCHCNDGFSGCSCEVPDVNECNYRPCHTFAHCTNTLGSFFCTCMTGYQGDGYHCEDINECDDPAIAARCVENAECCNLPSHFLCKCNSGFEGDGESQCLDVDECLIPGACGHNARCINTPGNYTCDCLEGFYGDPYDGCADLDECELSNACGPGAICTNLPGGKSCTCKPGYEGDAYGAGCYDSDECARSNPCGRDALCTNLEGSFRCACPPGFVGDPAVSCSDISCHSHEECPSQQACISAKCQNPCSHSNPCHDNQDCQVQNHQPVCVKVSKCQCQRHEDCRSNDFVCDGCKCVNRENPIIQTGCEHCPPGVACDPTTGACIKEPGNPKAPKPCESDNDCFDSEACYMSMCQDPCEFAKVCAATAKCQAKMHRPICTCPMGYEGNPAVKCFKSMPIGCTSNEHCPITEACIAGGCQRPCDVHDPCAQHAVCINTNHGSDCSCAEGYQGNGYVGCVPVVDYKPICQYNEDCPPNKLCDRLNRICINPCFEDSCGENAECVPKNHGIDCQCLPGHLGNPYVFCDFVQGCRSDSECPDNLACIAGKCNSPCKCGPNAICDVIRHKPQCKCPLGYTGNPISGCSTPTNPCDPNPCGINALCELDNGNPICYCPKGLTGNPFKNCIPEGDECTPNPCGPNSGCRLVGGKAICFCLPEFEGNPPTVGCALPDNPCNPSPCGPNTQCSILSNGFAKCTCLAGYLESPNTIRGCIEQRNPCEPNPCGHGAQCDPHHEPVCFCPQGLFGNPYRSCSAPVNAPILCQPGPCGDNADCYVSDNLEQCYCKPGFVGDAYIGCRTQPKSACTPNPCSAGAVCVLTPDGSNSMCQCPEGMGGDPTGPNGCHGFQCLVDDDCGDSEACIGHRCRDPCPGSCGVNANCRVEKHHPVCTCNAGLTGNPVIRCFPIPVPMPANDPCMPSPCGLNTLCQVIKGRAVCSCLPDFAGDPQFGCKPECVVNADCPGDKACLNRHCINPCSIGNLCGINALCSVEYHTATCRCPEGYTGDAFSRCITRPIIEHNPLINISKPCYPSPCEGSFGCDVYGTQVAICDPCLGPNAIYHPHCRPECLTNSDCRFDAACLGGSCTNPCIGSCGVGADCTVVSHTPVCSCPKGLYGNAFEHCSPPSHPGAEKGTNNCENVQCGSNAICRHTNNALACVCKKGFFGNPWIACRPECVINSDCPMTKSCMNNKCVDPCAGACGISAQCQSVNHIPICFCPADHTGDPFVSCFPYKHQPPTIENLEPSNPCDPSPCGPFSRCLVSPQGYATCSCLPTYRGTAPACKPECVVSSECAQSKACVNQRCVDPCPGTCGIQARCEVINHNPICTCPIGHQGDPFVSCYQPIVVVEPKEPNNPCTPSPCGPNSICQPKQGRPVCSCNANYIGSPPHCRPECVINQECPRDKSCIREKCVDPCQGKCGKNAKCDVVNHTPFCSCQQGYEGDAFIGCSKIVELAPIDPCNPSPCGENAQCTIQTGLARCTCIPPYMGNPYSGGCRPECTINSDCPSHFACLAQHCRDPCQGLCGINAECNVVNHAPICACPRGMIGDPMTSCRKQSVKPPVNPCEPSPCGSNSVCRIKEGIAVCSCQPKYIGSPPNCRPECLVSSECSLDKACINQRCSDPCPGTCGLNARCQVVNHNPICSCPSHYTGDPFSQCIKEEVRMEQHPSSPCVPSPCGPNAECRVIDSRPVCSCVLGMFGAPPNCRPECVINQDCPSHLACVNNKCKDPCIGSCGFNALCTVQNHRPLCSCQTGYEGDPFVGCNQIQAPIPVETRNPCNPSPCGANAICREQNGAGSCTCLPEYLGDPYTGCRPECVTNSDCDRTKACVNNKCKDPCPGTCGLNAECLVFNHSPSCSCISGYTGNPTVRCNLIEAIIEQEAPKNPCSPSPCGPYSQCREYNGHAVCSCNPGYVGAPPMCKPECVVSSECPQNKACSNQKCVDPCPGTCGIGAKCQVINHNPICSCPVGQTGDPFIRCQTIQLPSPPKDIRNDPCVPSPCGPNSQCRVHGEQAACSCLPNYVGRAPNCRPECTTNSECPNNLACRNEKCRNPCSGTCGQNAICTVVNHNAICSCLPGFVGDATIACQLPPPSSTERTPPASPCFPSPCGPNAECRERDGAGACVCPANYMGDPYDKRRGCHRECESNGDCSPALACVAYKCVDPCPGTCGVLAECHVSNHVPTCTCITGFTGDPFFQCREITVAPPPRIPVDPCNPSPCGPNSQCKNVDSHSVCSCMPNYVGNPPSCRPECVVSSECPLDRACINQKCGDPCPNTCGLGAQCYTKNHNPICACPPGFTGDPFTRCSPRPVIAEITTTTERPPSCHPSPCGPNSNCQIRNGAPSCSCLPNYVGAPPNCRPECVINSECSSPLACINLKCKDPCPGSCGANANCHVLNHVPICTCDEGHTGDPFTQCRPKPPPQIPKIPEDPCNPSPCGPNAICKNGICSCLPEYLGNPYESCRPECVLGTECSRDKACIRNKCKDPCPGTCGQNARCDVINHIPTCSCPEGYTGDPFTHCRVQEPPKPEAKRDPCHPSPCGPNSRCINVNDHSVCSCLQGFVGTPPSCKPECVVSSECASTKACVNQKCTDPCLGSCGLNARCEVINHSPICSCPEGQTGDPFQSCRLMPKLPPQIPEQDHRDPCNPSPCGPNSQCRNVGNNPSCTCVQGYIGQPPNCRPECVINPDCPSTQACINNKCQDPCPGSCGDNAECRVITHTVSCYCSAGFTGNPFVQCVVQKQEVLNPCEPSPCGANAVCKERNGAGSCICLPDYQGNPYEGCRPECVLSADCPTNSACVRNKCQDPCPGVCGTNAECNVINHVPTCTCIYGYVGNPFSSCTPEIIQPTTEASVVDPCSPSPCGPNSQCRNVNDVGVCSCMPEYIGNPPNCRPECVVSSECPQDKACHKFKCANPCRGTCGVSARCEVINHNPICSCPGGLTGDPFTRCYPLPPPPPPQPKPASDPCVPTPCGTNSICRVINEQPSCSCQPNFVGVPPNCRPECVVNTDCQSDLACITEKCRDPCPGSCGFNAECRVQNHIPICTCVTGFEGDPFIQCTKKIEPIVKVPTDPCNPSPCGPNAQCRDGICSCLPEYQGDPYSGCRPECTMNTDCAPSKSCSNSKCIDPCPGTCGQNAKCDVVNHIPTCSCPQGLEGDPFTLCKQIVVHDVPKEPCNPSPCGPNSICKVINTVAVCSCQINYIGSPPSCRPECIVSAECPLTQACLNNKCIDPCPGTCGINAKCQVVNHNPICSCTNGNTGDPFTRCFPMPVEQPRPADVNPCVPSPCGSNSVCQVRGESPACSCLANFIGLPPNCRPECTINPECRSELACINQKCRDPCPGSCGSNAVCNVVNHTPVCSCNPGFTGDPFTGCITKPVVTTPPSSEKRDPCYPSPCGPNARCRTEHDQAICECLPEYRGNPYESCRPECVANSDCPMNRACIRNKCQDPCPGTCGVNAICDVTNHIPICTCPQGFAGDAFRQCVLQPKVTEAAESDPCDPSPCGINTICRKSGPNAICECTPGFHGSPTAGGCRPECTISADCPRNKACSDMKCFDPCPGVCGFDAVCHVINHSPVCSCPPPLLGDPFTLCREQPVPEPVDPCNPSPCRLNGQCRISNGLATCIYPECVINQDCPRDKACYSQKCRDPCRDACGVNALCQAINHKAVCTCPTGYIGVPEIQCRLQDIQEPKPECTQDSDCTNDKACINQQCKNPCAGNTNICGANAECRVQLHRPICICREGYTGNAQSACFEIGCRSDSDCPAIQACVNRECVDPCVYTQCGINALCRADSNHKARCYCPDHFRGSPQIRCERPECTIDDECPYNLACRNERCEDPCNCGPRAICSVTNHRPQCSCPPGYNGNPLISCDTLPVVYEPQCKMDADCASRLACFSGTCKNPCIETKPCGRNAECSVVDTLPLRTMSCLCLPGYVGNADTECTLAPQDEPGCKSSGECSSTEACLNRQCVNPCAIANPCALTAECTPTNHKAVCRCPAGLIGDPFIRCLQEPKNKPECTIDADCAGDRACTNQRCQDPCTYANPCGNNANCRTIQHRPTCKCPDGWGGNPQVLCYKPECKSDNDCPYDKSCINENCLNPCASTTCGRGAECIVQNHHSKCQCPAGTQGNPMVSCIAGICQYNEDCADHEACDRLNRVCRPVCDEDTCADTATCVGRNHQPRCSCPLGTSGSPYVECLSSRVPEPECKTDSDCPTQLACMNAKCQNPCAINNVCTIDQECRVLDSLPLRTVMCQCPPDTFIDNNGRCRAVIHDAPQCHVDSDCSDKDKCIRGSCIEACKVDLCGVNAQCNSRYHQAICTCAPGYTGNAHIECNTMPKIPTLPIPIPECYSDDECTYDKSCRNDRCVNPCLDDNPCAIGAFCSINNHRAVCKCPENYEGNPRIECVPPIEPTVGCKSSSDCSKSQSCVNARCVSPCNCGTNAECRVTDHYPICFCNPGYSGNPQTGCVKLGCQSDRECGNDQQCYNGQCINPCILGDPCAASAECYGDNHRATCRCPSGYNGNPFERCERVECHVDSECPRDKACLQQRCVDPCSSIANPPCAHNAICYAQNHAAGCLCPSHLPEGNPLSYCSGPVIEHGQPECQLDIDCPSKMACIQNTCVNPCYKLSPCHRSAHCSVLDTIPVRTMICTCPEGWVPNNDGECQAVIVPSPPGCTSDDDCSNSEACINRMCRNPCDCGTNSQCHVQNHRPVCSCENGFEGNPNIACHTIGCRVDSECDSGKACTNGNCINPCLIEDPCGVNAECYVHRNRAQCRCLSGYRGNPMDRCLVVGCTSNSDCPNDRQCINAQCINPCVYDKPCSPRADCHVQNHIALCRCPAGYMGNPFVDCRREPRPECREDYECPARLACLSGKCRDPCAVLEPCHTPSECQVVPSVPVRTMICVCPPGYISSGSGTCTATTAVRDIGGCVADKECPANRACVQGICKNPCNCGLNAECRIKDHKPICTCKQGFDGNPELECSKIGCRTDDECSPQHTCINRQCVPVCAADGTSCGTHAKCLGINHRPICECPPGYMGNPKVACVLIGCRSSTDCPMNRACVNEKCEDPCKDANACTGNAECRAYGHQAVCACPSGYNGDGHGGCTKEEEDEKCRSDGDCPSQTACIGGECVNPCTATEPCGVNSECRVLDTTPVRTMICECLPGYQGNAAVQCDKMALCRTDKGFISNTEGDCVCPPSTALNENDECILCPIEKGLKVDERGRCVCALERGLIIDERGNCVCPVEYGYRLDARGNCVPITGPECEHDDHCPDNKFCNPTTKTCDDPCSTKNCGLNALCNATNHEAVCQCITGYTGDPEILCNRTSPFRTDFPRPEILVSCLSDGVQVEIHITEQGFNGVLYVKGHSKDEQCRRVVTLPPDSVPRNEIFKVQFGNCGLIHVNGQASFVLVIQKHPKLVTYKAQAYHIKCMYQTGEQNVTLGFNVSMLTTAGTIANTGPPPTCLMRIVTPTGQEINSAEIGDKLQLQVEVQPGSIYGGFARSCVAKTMEDNMENEYIVTDEHGCATEPDIFGEWDYNPDTQSLLASFDAFKFPNSDNIRFQCNIRVCFGKCQPVNCRGYNAFGRRRRAIDDDNSDDDNGTELAVTGDLLNGQLREEITIQSNAILTFERREERFTDPQQSADAQRVEDICVSMIGFIIALIITALLALVAVAVAVSCWLMAYRRRPKATGPLPHPPEFPNPLFTTPEPMAEPSPDYLT